jgi:putative phage-type endonuclease
MDTKFLKKIPNINARDFATILNINPYQTPFQLLESKIEKKYPFIGNKCTEHGNKYEKSAIKVYSDITGNIVESKQKNTKHKNHNWITGRYDGITTLNNNKKRKREEQNDLALNRKKKRRKTCPEEDIIIKNNDEGISNYEIENNKCIIEIKCPFKKDRIEELTLNNIPKYYWTQCQVYMNMLDCENSHYIEYYIEPETKDEESGKLYYINIERDRKWWEESLPKIMLFHEEVKKYSEQGSLETHPVRLAEKEWQKKFA